MCFQELQSQKASKYNIQQYKNRIYLIHFVAPLAIKEYTNNHYKTG